MPTLSIDIRIKGGNEKNIINEKNIFFGYSSLIVSFELLYLDTYCTYTYYSYELLDPETKAQRVRCNVSFNDFV